MLESDVLLHALNYISTNFALKIKAAMPSDDLNVFFVVGVFDVKGVDIILWDKQCQAIVEGIP